MRCLIWNSGRNVHSQCCVDDVQNGHSTSSSHCCCVLSTSRSLSIETTSLNISVWAMATCLRAGGCFSTLHASHEKCFRAPVSSSLTFASRTSFSTCCADGVQVPVKSLDVFLAVHWDIVPVVPIFPARSVRTRHGVNSIRLACTITSRTC